MNELTNGEIIPTSGRSLMFKVELHGGTAKFFNELSDGSPEELKNFDGNESALDRRFKHEIVDGERYYFSFTGAAKAFYK